MNKNFFWAIFLCLEIVTVFLAEPALAGPGGKIAKAMFETFWGKVLLGILTIIFLPLIIYVLIREKIAERRAKKDLAFMARHHSHFEWLKIRERALDCFHRIHSAWKKEDMVEASEYMSHWYWQNQQLVFINQWEQAGLVNHCEVKKVTAVRPLHFMHRNDEKEHEGSVLVLFIEANMQDYLAERVSGKVVEGSKKFKEVGTLWSFTMIEGKWRVTNIEEDSFSLEYAKLVRELPPIEDTLLSKERV